MESSDVVLVLTTIAATVDAEGFARTLVEENLAACVNVSAEIQSTYRWQGAMTVEAERQLFIKTTAGRVADLRTRFVTLHPYSVPEFLVFAIVDGGPDYLSWVRQSVTP